MDTTTAVARALHGLGDSCRYIRCEVVGHAGEAEELMSQLSRVGFQVVTIPDESEPCFGASRLLRPEDLPEGSDGWILQCNLPHSHPGPHMAQIEGHT